jgi:hypothetical protein
MGIRVGIGSLVWCGLAGIDFCSTERSGLARLPHGRPIACPGNRPARPLLEPFDALGRDVDFWDHTLDGLAVLGGPGGFHVFMLAQPVAEFIAVARSFHTKPLRRSLQATDRYQILALSLDKARLFEGSRDALEEIELVKGVPRTIDEALGSELSEPHRTVAPAGQPEPVPAGRWNQGRA